MYQQFAAQSAPTAPLQAQSGPHSHLQPYPQSDVDSSQSRWGYQSNPQQAFQSPSQPQWQSAVPMQQPFPQSMQSIVGPQFCAPYPVTYYVKDKLLSWSGGDVSILDGQGGLAFTVDSKAMSMRGNRVLQDAAGNPVCAMKQKLMSMKSKWVICRGGQITDSSVVASVNRELWTMHRAVQAKLPGSDNVEYSMRDKGWIIGKREIDILHRGQIIGHATRLRSGEAIFLDKQSYKVDISPGYDHAFVLCLIVIMDHYFHQDQAVIA